MKFIDAHAHMHDKKYDEDRDEVIARFFDEGGEAIVNIGTSIGESRDAVELAEAYEDMYATVGLHPHVFNGGAQHNSEWKIDLGADVPAVVRRERLEDALYDLEEIIKESEKVVAIGEIGLDYFSHDDHQITDIQKGWQTEGFCAQIELAQKHDLPVVVHCRPEDVAASDAYFDCVDVLAEYEDVQFVMHCYMGNREVTEKFLAMENVSFSFTGNVTYSKSDDDEMSEVVKMIPLERMMIETDAPYLTPVPHRGTRNEPTYVQYVAKRIAALTELPLEKVIEQTTFNTKEFFDI